MTASALLLAVAVLASAGPMRARRWTDAVHARPRRSPPPTRRDDPFATASALDVFAVCLSSGMAVSTAAAATAPSAPPALRAVLGRAADLLALGADPATAWSAPNAGAGGGGDEGCDALMRLARRSASSGSALAQGVSELAAQSRQAAADASVARAERAGVLIAGPLGLCFLPAFIVLGVIPVVAGLAGDVFGAGML